MHCWFLARLRRYVFPLVVLFFAVIAPALAAQTTASDSVNYSDLLKSAELAFDTGDYRRAAAEFSVLYDRFPEDTSISNNYAVALFQAGLHADAAAVIQQFLTEHAEVGELTNNLFTIYDYMASESYALLDGVEPDLPDLRLSDSVANISEPDPVSKIDPISRDSAPDTGSLAAETTFQSATRTSVPDNVLTNQITISPVYESAPSNASSQNVAGASVDSAEAAKIESRLNDFVNAWMTGDVRAYLGFYYPGVSPVAGVNYDDWYQSRVERIFPERQIEIGIDELKVHFESDEDVVMEYMQRYRSRNYSDRTLKQMRWKKYQGVWYIRNERSLPR